MSDSILTTTASTLSTTDYVAELTAQAVADHAAKYAPAPSTTAPVTPSEYQKAYELAIADNARMQLVLQAARLNGAGSTPGAGSTKAKITADRVRGLLGDNEFRKLTRSERLTAVGVDPSISDEFISKIFGRKFDASLSRDLHRSDPEKYNRLREASKILNLFAA